MRVEREIHYKILIGILKITVNRGVWIKIDCIFKDGC